MGIFSSLGIKRQIVSWLTVIVGIVLSIPVLPPGVQSAVTLLNKLIEILGGVAVTHAAVEGTLTKDVLLSAGSSINVIIGLAWFIPVLVPFVPILVKLNLIINSLAVGTTLTRR